MWVVCLPPPPIVLKKESTWHSPTTTTHDNGGQGGAIFKLILGSWDQSNWVGPHFPNASTNFEPADFVEHCTIPGKKIGCFLVSSRSR